MVALSVPGMVNAFSENLDSRFKSLSITNESLLVSHREDYEVFI
jgi:hypothetical protein